VAVRSGPCTAFRRARGLRDEGNGDRRRWRTAPVPRWGEFTAICAVKSPHTALLLGGDAENGALGAISRIAPATWPVHAPLAALSAHVAPTTTARAGRHRPHAAAASPITFSRRSSAFSANVRVSVTDEPRITVAGDPREAVDEARQGPGALVVVDDEVLAGQRHHPLEDHVVDRDRLHERLEVLRLGGQAIDATVQRVVEQLAELRVQVVARRCKRASSPVASKTPTSE
jgi:hypothetical protein